MGTIMPKRACVISFVNWKGGVGKTTCAVNITAELAYYFHRKVLVIDMDPQATASLYLYTRQKFEEEYSRPIVDAIRSGREEESVEKGIAKKSVYGLFLDILEDTDFFDKQEGIKKGVSGITTLDLLPATYLLVKLDEVVTLKSMNTGISTFNILLKGLEKYGITNDYDFIIIDCPPNLRIGALNAVFASDYYIIPTIPDTLSATGIPLLIRSLQRVKRRKMEDLKQSPQLLGILYTRVSHQMRSSQRPWMNDFIPFMLDQFKRENLVWEKAVIFTTVISDRVAVH